MNADVADLENQLGSSDRHRLHILVELGFEVYRQSWLVGVPFQLSALWLASEVLEASLSMGL